MRQINRQPDRQLEKKSERNFAAKYINTAITQKNNIDPTTAGAILAKQFSIKEDGIRSNCFKCEPCEDFISHPSTVVALSVLSLNDWANKYVKLDVTRR